ncbi:hypothetical protein V8V91_00700 [Algoriphagus halophilus]
MAKKLEVKDFIFDENERSNADHTDIQDQCCGSNFIKFGEKQA